jgi:hypothetical protein
MKESVHKVRGAIHLAEYSHKHGVDYSVHITQEGAKDWFRDIVSEWKSEFIEEGDPFYLFTTDELVSYWPEVTGQSEFFNIHELELQK